jgi:hypothetical protein
MKTSSLDGWKIIREEIFLEFNYGIQKFLAVLTLANMT